MNKVVMIKYFSSKIKMMSKYDLQKCINYLDKECESRLLAYEGYDNIEIEDVVDSNLLSIMALKMLRQKAFFELSLIKIKDSNK